MVNCYFNTDTYLAVRYFSSEREKMLLVLLCIERGLCGCSKLSTCGYRYLSHCNAVLTCSGKHRVCRHIRRKYARGDLDSLTVNSICGDFGRLQRFALVRPADE